MPKIAEPIKQSTKPNRVNKSTKSSKNIVN